MHLEIIYLDYKPAVSACLSLSYCPEAKEIKIFQSVWSFAAGGLGDVMAALPKALSRRGHRVMAIAPRYEHYAEGWETGVRIRIRVYDQEHEVRRIAAQRHKLPMIAFHNTCIMSIA